MGALTSIKPAVTGLVRNPILLVITGVYGLFQLPQLLLQSQDPLLSISFSLGITGVFILLFPFFQGGLLGMASDALTGHTSLQTLITVGKANYITLLLGYLVLFAINITFGIMVFLGVLIGGISLFASDTQPGLTTLMLLGIIGLVVLLAYLLVWFFIQFYAHAIVLTNTDLVEGFTHSVTLVRRNLLSVLGYTMIIIIGGGLFGLIGGGASVVFASEQPPFLTLPEPTPLVLGLAALVYVVSTAVMGAFYVTYSVAVYQSITPSTPVQ